MNVRRPSVTAKTKSEFYADPSPPPHLYAFLPKTTTASRDMANLKAKLLDDL